MPVGSFAIWAAADQSTVFPNNPSKAPFTTCIKPCPPESTTPACLSTGNISGVWLNTKSPWAMISLANSSTSAVFSAISTALSAMPFATVRIVPSFGFMTALYAVSVPRTKARASVGTFTVLYILISFVNPRNNWDKITPEFPLAPRKEPEEIALASVSIVGSFSAATSLAAAMMVIVIFVPVSPSGTGNTFSSLIHSFFASNP